MNKKIKLFFIHRGKLSNNTGHTARLRYELDELSKRANIFILSLANEMDQIYVDKYPDVQFYNIPMEFRGWEVVNLNHLIEQIGEKTDLCKPDIVILCIEIWDLIIELHKMLKDKIAFCAICHAVPFLGSPLNPTKYFEIDVKKNLDEQILEYRRDYILKHHKEFHFACKSFC